MSLPKALNEAVKARVVTPSEATEMMALYLKHFKGKPMSDLQKMSLPERLVQSFNKLNLFLMPAWPTVM